MTPTPNDVLTLQEAAKSIRLHPETVAKLIAAGELPGYVFGNGRKATYRIPIDAWATVLDGTWVPASKRPEGTRPAAPVKLLHTRSTPQSEVG